MKNHFGLRVVFLQWTVSVFILTVSMAWMVPGAGAVQSSMDWTSEYLLKQDNFMLSGQHNLLFDNQNNPWIFLSGDTVQALHHSENEWITHEISDSPAVGLCAILDGAGQPVVCFTDQKTRNVKLATFSGSVWNITSVDTSGECDESVGLIQDSTGCLHIFFIKSLAGDDNLVHLYNSAGDWQSEVIYTESRFFDNIAVIETAPGVIGIAFITYHSNLCQILYMNPVTPGSAVETVASTGMLQNFTAIKLVTDSTGQCRILAAHGSRGGPVGLLYGYRQESGWITGYPFDGVMQVNDPGMEILIDSSDVSHLFFTSEQNAVHAWKVGEQWNSETQLLDGERGASIAAGYDRMGQLQSAIIINTTGSEESLLYGSHLSGDWDLDVIKMGGGEILETSFQADTDGTLYVGVCTASRLLCITQQSGIAQIETLSSGYSSYDCDLAIDSNGNPGIVSTFGDDIVLWERISGNWSSQIVRNVSYCNELNLVYSTEGIPHIVYYARETSHLYTMHHSFRTQTGWVDQPIDLGITSELSSIHFDLKRGADGIIHFVSVDRIEVDLQSIVSIRFGTLGESGWVVESQIMDSDYYTSLYSVNLAFDNLGNPHAVITCSGPSLYSGQVLHATRTGSIWTFEEVTQLVTQEDPGIVITSDSMVWISAPNSSDDDMIDIWRKQTDWNRMYHRPQLYWFEEAFLFSVPGSDIPSCLITDSYQGDIQVLSPRSASECTDWVVSGRLNATRYSAGMPFHFDLDICNPSDALDSAPLISILEVLGEYYFYPDWSKSVDFELLSIPPGESNVPILHFTMPDPLTVSMDSLNLYGALLRPDFSEVLGSIWHQDFSIGPE